jgi:urease gamma subunit
VGEVHDAAKNAFVSGVRTWLQAILNGRDGLVRKLVDYNFGPQEVYPEVVIALPETQAADEDSRRASYATAIQTLKAAGALTLGPEDEAAVRERMGLPSRSEMREAEDAEEDPAPLGLAERPGLARALWRELRPSERCLDLASLDAFFEGGRARFEAAAKPILAAMVGDARGKMAAAMKDGDPGELEGLELDTDKLHGVVAEFVASAAEFGRDELRAEVERGGAHALADEDPKLVRRRPTPGEKPTAKFELVIPKAATDAVKRRAKGLQLSLDAQIKMLVDRIETRARQAVWNEAIEAVRAGRSADSAIDAVLRAFDDAKTLRQDAGVVLSRSMSIGREAGALETGIERFEFSAVLDPATCSPCRDADGTVVEANSEEHYAIMPPYARCAGGANCRCVLVPVA